MKRSIAGILVFMIIFIVILPSTAQGAWREFVPRLQYTGAFLDLTAVDTSATASSGERTVSFKEISFVEDLTINFVGYSYDPRFISFALSLTGGFAQEKHTFSSQESAGWRTGSDDGYNLVIKILPKHPYTLTLFTSRTRPLVFDLNNVTPSFVEYRQGADFKFTNRPHYVLTASYTRDTIENLQGANIVDTFRLGGRYAKTYSAGREISFTGDYFHQNFSTPSITGGTSDSWTLSNGVKYHPLLLSSTVSISANTQPSDTVPLKNEALSWREALYATLPLNFNASVIYQYQKNTSNTLAESSGSNFSNSSQEADLNITHHLYQSLTSVYSLRHNETISPLGNENTTIQSLGFNYVKKIPGGNLTSLLTYSEIRSAQEWTGDDRQ